MSETRFLNVKHRRGSLAYANMQRIKTDKQRDLCRETRRVSLQDVTNHHLQQGRAS